jgi:hypothetical protein
MNECMAYVLCWWLWNVLHELRLMSMNWFLLKHIHMLVFCLRLWNACNMCMVELYDILKFCYDLEIGLYVHVSSWNTKYACTLTAKIICGKDLFLYNVTLLATSCFKLIVKPNVAVIINSQYKPKRITQNFKLVHSYIVEKCGLIHVVQIST